MSHGRSLRLLTLEWDHILSATVEDCFLLSSFLRNRCLILRVFQSSHSRTSWYLFSFCEMLFVVSVQFYLQYINDGDVFCDFLAITLYNVYVLYQSENLREKLSQKPHFKCLFYCLHYFAHPNFFHNIIKWFQSKLCIVFFFILKDKTHSSVAFYLLFSYWKFGWP